MPTKRLSVVVTRRLPKAVETRMTELFDVTLREQDTPMSREELKAAVQSADVLVPTITDEIDAGLLGNAGKNLKLIANYGSGVDHIDVSTARQRGILVSNTPGVLADDTADMTMALMLAVMRRFREGSQHMQSGDWSGWSPSAFLGARLGGKRLGILGMGQVGTAVAKRANAFGMIVASLLNGFGCASLPHAHLAGMFLKPTPALWFFRPPPCELQPAGQLWDLP